MEDNFKDLSIIIACYNEEPHLEASVGEIKRVLNATKYTYELIFIDDCSKDKTCDIIKNICKDNPTYRYIFHEKNVGRGGTVKEGLLSANTKFAGFLDIDLEVHARYIPSMIRALENGADVVCANRIYNFTFDFINLLRTILSRIYKSFFTHYLLGIKFSDPEAGYKFFNSSSMKEVIQATEDEKWFWDTEIIARAENTQKRIDAVPVAFVRRPEKKSTVRLIPDIYAYLKAIKKFKHNLLI